MAAAWQSQGVAAYSGMIGAVCSAGGGAVSMEGFGAATSPLSQGLAMVFKLDE